MDIPLPVRHIKYIYFLKIKHLRSVFVADIASLRGG
jgi:hypothetical protein